MSGWEDIETDTDNKNNYRILALILATAIIVIAVAVVIAYFIDTKGILQCEVSSRNNQSESIGLIQETSLETSFQVETETVLSSSYLVTEKETEHLSEETVVYLATDNRIESESESESEPSDEEKFVISKKIISMTTEEKVAQMFMITPEALTGVGPVTVAGDTTKQAYQQYPVGGLIYYEDNIIGRDQWLEMTNNMISLSMHTVGLPVFIGVDEEGGTVRRLSGRIEGLPEIPSMGSIGESGDPSKAYETGLMVGEYLREMNINLDFAPDADVNSNPSNTVIGDRAFSDDPELTAGMVAAAVQGFHDEGVLCTIKHFPGHGDTAGDSHSGMVFSYKGEEELYQCELMPFISGIEAGADCVMIGHISLPNIIGDNTPSSLSYAIITGLLREELGFDGIVITDAMNMGAISNNYDSGQAAIQSIKAGVDIVLMPADFQRAYNAVLDEVRNGNISIDRIDQSCYRIVKAKLKIRDYKKK